ncbi:MAG: phosphoserine transaminase [Puniceicoccaceae bacterium MED-G30]|nr:MAG: phosphoserine transaminase [Puniceicoccaceae bacterium MED-G30]
MKPATTPRRPFFSSGPCAKRPGWSLDALDGALLGRSHRAKNAKARIRQVIDDSREILGLPEGYVCGIVPASDTGAIEMAMWSLLGARGLDICAWESFGSAWITDVVKQLKLEDVTRHEADYGKLPDLSAINFDNDVVFTYNGTTSGVRVPNLDWIPQDHDGLVLCDATSAVFAMDLDYSKLDVITWSWQKVMGGEAAHGMIALSPRAIERLETYSPPWPLPKIFRMSKGGKLIQGIFEGATINTVSMLCVEDAVDGLEWARSIGGLPALLARSEANLQAVAQWAEKSDWIDFLAEDPATRSCTSICLKIVDPWYQGLSHEEQAAKAKELVKRLESENIAYDFGSYRDAPPGIRIWGGATVDAEDTAALLPWLDWAFAQIKAEG